RTSRGTTQSHDDHPAAHTRLTPLSRFVFIDTATTEIYTLSLHDALPISGISSFVWLLLSSPIAKVSAISKPVFVPSNPSSIIWASAGKFLATRWHTPTSIATGGSTPISLRF